MALETVNETIAHSTTLFRPVPVSKLQKNLASFYERTSRFVDEQFRELVDGAAPEKSAASAAQTDHQEEVTQLKPPGLGALIDIYV